MESMKKMLLVALAALSLGTAVAHEGCEQAPVDTTVDNVVEEAHEEVAQTPEIAAVEEQDEVAASEDEVEQALNDMTK